MVSDMFQKPQWADELGFDWPDDFDTICEVDVGDYLRTDDIQEMTPRRLTEIHDETGYSRAQITRTVELIRERATGGDE